MRREIPYQGYQGYRVSIHAPREGCDLHVAYEDADLTYVSIHAPREGCDLSNCSYLSFDPLFQFTHPGRGATIEIDLMKANAEFQFTHPGRGATQNQLISSQVEKFQFTHPGRGATGKVVIVIAESDVSIHAPREGCDKIYYDFYRRQDYVSIHAPREGCDIKIKMLIF